MRVLILGASGQIGNALFARLKEDGVWVVGTTRKEDKTSLLLRFNPFTDDWRTLGKFDVLINCIGNIIETKSNTFDTIHTTLTRIILQQRCCLGNPKIIQLSALGADKDHAVGFLRTKGIADALLLQETNTYVIRPSIVCTPHTMVVKKLQVLLKLLRFTKNHFLFPKGFLSSCIQPVMITDLLDLISKVIFNHFYDRIIDVAGPTRITYRYLIELSVSDLSSCKEIDASLVEKFVKYLIAPFFPSLITFDQYQLLFYHNVSSSSVAENILGRRLNDCQKFWTKHLTN